MNFILGFLLLVDSTDNNYDSIMIIVDNLTKTVYYKPIRTIINTLDLAKMIIDIMMRYDDLFESIMSNRGLLFFSKFCFSLFQLFITFHL